MNNRLTHNGEFVTVNQHKIHIYRQGNINNDFLINRPLNEIGEKLQKYYVYKYNLDKLKIR